MTDTRFAPSPTGDLHIGGVRTALYCWLQAKKTHGNFRLRIEDTDQQRSTQASTQVILDGLAWLGLHHDGEVIYQSQRFTHYQQIIAKMIEQGLAYHCWCSAEELEAMREAQKARGEKPRYNGKYRNGGTPVEGVNPVVRFKNPLSGVVTFEDKVRGTITISNNELDDFIIQRSDGSPTYNFCVVIDDAEQGIDLVIRGDDHINNTPKQINLYQSLGYKIPEFAHVPMILGDDGKRLSKRHGATNVLDYRNEGYLPQAILNYLVRLGWSHGDQEIFSLEEMIDYFSIKDVHSAAATFNTEKLRWLNQHYLKESSPEMLIKPLMQQFEMLDIKIEHEKAKQALIHYQERAKTLKEMAENMRWIAQTPLHYPEKAVKKAFKGAESSKILADMANEFAQMTEFAADGIHKAIEHYVEANNLGFGKVGQPLRLAITGGAPSPDLHISLALLEKNEVIKRLNNAISYIESMK